MSGQVLDGAVAVLWGSSTRELNWIHLSPKNGRVSVARAHANGFWVRDEPGVPNVEGIAHEAVWAWKQLRNGADLSDNATHRLKPPQLQEIEPIGGEA